MVRDAVKRALPDDAPKPAGLRANGSPEAAAPAAEAETEGAE